MISTDLSKIIMTNHDEERERRKHKNIEQRFLFLENSLIAEK